MNKSNWKAYAKDLEHENRMLCEEIEKLSLMLMKRDLDIYKLILESEGK